jgi:DnaJ-class molecular chaperone
MANAMTATVKVECGKCAGSGRYHFHGGSDICYPCNGTGSVRMSAAELAKMKADAARLESYRAEQLAEEAEESAAYDAAAALIAAKGIAGAREFFAANRTNRTALAGLILAMRDAQMEAASNAVVAHRNAL